MDLTEFWLLASLTIIQLHPLHRFNNFVAFLAFLDSTKFFERLFLSDRDSNGEIEGKLIPTQVQEYE